jgi:hypothetical protein
MPFISLIFARSMHQSGRFVALFLLAFSLFACNKTADSIDPALQSPPPAGVGGNWLYGRFSPSSFWGTDGSYQGAANEQALAFSFGPNGTYDMYVMNVTTSYGCRTGSYTYMKGKVKFNESDHSITMTPAQGTYRGEYGCTPSSNFKRDATASEVEGMKRTFYYATETDAKGKPVLRIFFGTNDDTGAEFSQGDW